MSREAMLWDWVEAGLLPQEDAGTLENDGSLTLQDVMAGEVADLNAVGGIPVVHRFAITAGGEADFDITMKHKTRITDAHIVLKGAGAAGCSVTLQNGATAITDAMAATGSDKAIVRATTLDDAQWEVAAGGTLMAAVATTHAQGTLTMATKPTDGDTVTIGSKVYTFQDTLTDVDGNVFIGATVAASKVNLVAAINASGGTPGTTHALSTTAHPDVTAAAFVGDDMVVTAIVGGTAGNAIASTETFTDLTDAWDAATLGTTTAGTDIPACEVVAQGYRVA